MYDSHFGLSETPFTIAPDPRFLYMSERHREALAHLVYGFETDGGFVLLTGEVGTGKTTISRCLLEQLPDNVDVAVVLNPKVSAQELLATICDELHIEYPEGNTSLKNFVDCINAHLLEINSQGRKTVVIVEEAQNLEMDVLEQLRLLTNLETNQRKLLQIIMIGQPELLELLSRPELRQLEQRVTARYHLLPLSLKDSIEYVKHRLDVAGLKDEVFTYPLLKKIHKITGGIPRKINLLCDRAMLGAYVQNQRYIDRKILERAASEVFGDKIKSQKSSRKWLKWGVAAGLIALAVLLTSVIYKNRDYITSLVSNIKMSMPKASQTSANPVQQASIEDNVMENSDFVSMIDRLDTGSSKVNAFSSLLIEWEQNSNIPDNVPPCEIAREAGLACLVKNGNLRSLKLINRPAVLRLINKSGKPLYVTLIGLNNTAAALSINGKVIYAQLADLESRWLGDYTLFWKVPPGFSGAIKLGTNGPDVQWLASSLASINGNGPLNNSVKYDGTLIRQVKEFQLRNGLESDGIAGVQTLIHINSSVASGVPRLDGFFARQQSADSDGQDARVSGADNSDQFFG